MDAPDVGAADLSPGCPYGLRRKDEPLTPLKRGGKKDRRTSIPWIAGSRPPGFDPTRAHGLCLEAAEALAYGVRQAGPEATHVADRFHLMLMKNLGDQFHDWLKRHPAPHPDPEDPPVLIRRNLRLTPNRSGPQSLTPGE